LVGTYADTRKLISFVTKDDPLLVSQVKKTLGAVLRPVLGALNGYYSLNLTKVELQTIIIIIIIIIIVSNAVSVVAYHPRRLSGPRPPVPVAPLRAQHDFQRKA